MLAVILKRLNRSLISTKATSLELMNEPSDVVDKVSKEARSELWVICEDSTSESDKTRL